MTEIAAQLDRFTQEANNEVEFLIVELDKGLAGDRARETALSEWAAAMGHELRAPNKRNPFQSLVEGEVERLLGDMHFEDIVFRTKGPDEQRSQSIAAELVAHIGPADYQWSDFIIDDWTFCLVVVITQPLRAIVIAFMGED